MKCPSVRESLTEFLEERLEPGEAEQVELHLDQCESCASGLLALVDSAVEGPELKGVRWVLAAADPVTRPASSSRRWRWRVGVFALTAAAAIVVAVTLRKPSIEPSSVLDWMREVHTTPISARYRLDEGQLSTSSTRDVYYHGKHKRLSTVTELGAIARAEGSDGRCSWSFDAEVDRLVLSDREAEEPSLLDHEQLALYLEERFEPVREGREVVEGHPCRVFVGRRRNEGDELSLYIDESLGVVRRSVHRKPGRPPTVLALLEVDPEIPAGRFLPTYYLDAETVMDVDWGEMTLRGVEASSIALRFGRTPNSGFIVPPGGNVSFLSDGSVGVFVPQEGESHPPGSQFTFHAEDGPVRSGTVALVVPVDAAAPFQGQFQLVLSEPLDAPVGKIPSNLRQELTPEELTQVTDLDALARLLQRRCGVTLEVADNAFVRVAALSIQVDYPIAAYDILRSIADTNGLHMDFTSRTARMIRL